MASSVSFAEYDDVMIVMHYTEYTTDEIADSWFSREEIDSSKKEIDQLIQLMEQSNDAKIDDDEERNICIRGLEGRTQWRKERRYRLVKDMIESVLEEQASQWEKRDHEATAAVCRNKTKKSIALARMAAISDERTVSRYNKQAIRLTKAPSKYTPSSTKLVSSLPKTRQYLVRAA